MDATPAGVPRGQQGTPFTASNRRIASSPTQANDDRDTPVGSVYDVVIVGARCAGASLAMLLARRGRRVLVVERAGAGTNTLSTHALVRPAVTLMSRWGILNRLVDASTPAVRAFHFHYDDDEHLIDVRDDGDVDALYAPRRTVLDPILVAEARDAGAQSRSTHGSSTS